MNQNKIAKQKDAVPQIALYGKQDAQIEDHREAVIASLEEILPQTAHIESRLQSTIAKVDCESPKMIADRGDHRNPAVAKVEDMSPTAPIIAGGDNNVIAECAARHKNEHRCANLPDPSDDAATAAGGTPEDAPPSPEHVISGRISPYALAQLLRERFNFKALSTQERLGVYDERKGFFSFMRKKNFPLFVLQALDGTPYKSNMSQAKMDTVFYFLVNEPTLQASVDDFDCHDRLLNVRNGVVSIDDMHLFPHHPSYQFTSVLDVNFNPNVGKPTRFLSMLNEIFDDTDARYLCCESMAYLLSNNTSAKKIIYFLGVPNSGKTTLSRLLMHLHGRKYVSAIPLEQFAGRFEIGSMFHRRLNLCPEVETIGKKLIRTIKALSGGDPQTVELKYEDAFLADLKLKFLLASNVQPEIPAHVRVDEGFFSRFLFVPFDKTIAVQNRQENLAQVLFNEEGDAIFFVLLQFLQLWYKKKCSFVACERSDILWDDFRGFSTATEREYVRTFFVFDEEAFTDNKTLYFRYPEFCRKKNSRPFTLDELKSIVIRVFPMVRKARKRTAEGTNPIAGLKGIRLRKDGE